MLKAFKYRLYPNAGQKAFFAQQFGNVRKVYNLALDMRCMFWCGAGQSVSLNATIVQLPGWKEMYPYLALSNSQSLQYAVRQVDAAFTNWWKHGARHPQPRRRRGRQSFHNPQHCSIDWKRGMLSIPKCKDIPIVLHRRFIGAVKDVTVSKNPDGRYFASVLVDTAVRPAECSPVEPSTTVGIDTGLKTFAVCSDGRTFPSLHSARDEARRLRHYQRELRHKRKGSRSWNATQCHISKIHSRAVNRRRDYLHKVTYSLTHDSQVRTLCIEDLNVRGMMKNRHLAYGVADAAIGEFYTLLRYKCGWYGVNLVTIGRWDASSRTCSVCGAVNASLKLGDREWTCPSCGAHHDRDFNASVNIRNFGLRQTLPGDDREVTPADCSTVDDRRLGDLRSSGRVRQEKFRNATDAPAL